jgi:hypothetical protein
MRLRCANRISIFLRSPRLLKVLAANGQHWGLTGRQGIEGRERPQRKGAVAERKQRSREEEHGHHDCGLLPHPAVLPSGDPN